MTATLHDVPRQRTRLTDVTTSPGRPAKDHDESLRMALQRWLDDGGLPYGPDDEAVLGGTP